MRKIIGTGLIAIIFALAAALIWAPTASADWDTSVGVQAGHAWHKADADVRQTNQLGLTGTVLYTGFGKVKVGGQIGLMTTNKYFAADDGRSGNLKYGLLMAAVPVGERTSLYGGVGVGSQMSETGGKAHENVRILKVGGEYSLTDRVGVTADYLTTREGDNTNTIAVGLALHL